jgi:ankyrin repeat protein
MPHTDPPIAERLYEAAYSGEVNELARLLDGGDVIPPGAVNSALEAAAYEGRADAVRLLLDRGADPNRFDPSNGESILHFATSKTSHPAERTDVVRQLIAAGADVNSRTLVGVTTLCYMRDIRTRGETPLHRAAAFGEAEMVKALIAAGADKTAKDAHGESPLTWASWHLRDTEVLKLLLYGAFEGTLR